MSYNFNPQPGSWPPGLSVASMQVPIKPQITFPIPKDLYYATSYHDGAVRINQVDFLKGDAASSGSFTKFVCSFWATNMAPVVNPLDLAALSDYTVSFAAEGTFPGGRGSFDYMNFIIRVEFSGYLNLRVLDTPVTGVIGNFNTAPNVMGSDFYTRQPLLPAGVWHHYIASFDASVSRAQLAIDRGGGPAWGGGIFDSDLGFGPPNPPIIFHPGTAPQKVWSGFNFGIPTSFSNPSPSNTINWRIQAPTASLIDMAYFYFGISNTFFDLTAPGNLDCFVTTSLTPVDLGRGGSNVPLTCLVMHTGNAIDPFIGGKLQFPYNAATGRLWGGTLEDAPTQPPTGA